MSNSVARKGPRRWPEPLVCGICRREISEALCLPVESGLLQVCKGCFLVERIASYLRTTAASAATRAVAVKCTIKQRIDCTLKD